MRKLVVILVLGLLAACTGEQGLPFDDVAVTDGGAGDMTCGVLGALCCESAGNLPDMECGPGLYCDKHRGGGPPPETCKAQP